METVSSDLPLGTRRGSGGTRTVLSVLRSVGPQVLQALCLPPGSDRKVGEPALLDLVEGPSAPAGAVLLAVGCRPAAPATAAVIAEASAAGHAAVVIKLYGDDPGPAVTAAESAGIALLVAGDIVSWPHLHLLLSADVAGDRGARAESLSALVTGDLFALANAVAAMVGGAILIEDPQQNVLAYSSVPGQPIDEVRQGGMLGRQVSAELRLADVYERVRRSDAVERIVLPGIRPRLVAAIRAGDEPIGSIWAIEGDSGFPPDAERAMSEAARLASMHILRLRSTADVEQTARTEALGALLLGRAVPQLEMLSPAAGTEDVAVVAFQIAGGIDDLDGTLLARTADLVTVFCEGVHRNAVCVALGRTVYALLPSGRGADLVILRALVDRVVSRALDSLRVRLLAGIGGTVRDLTDVARSRDEADRVLQVLVERDDGGQVASIGDVRNRAILLQLQEIIAADPRLRLDVVDTIARHDAEKGTQYIATLRAYLDSIGDVPRAAARLYLHQNTFRNRVRRATEIFGLNLDDPDERLVLWLLLRTLG